MNRLLKKGFTMIELLVVLLIIGILAAVAAPMLLANAEKAKVAEAVAALGMIRQAEREYKVKTGSFLAVAVGKMNYDPTDLVNGPGLNINMDPAKYFSTSSYSVVLGATGTLMADGVNFVIKADGAASSALVTATGVGARNAGEVSTMTVEMDNSGKTVYRTTATGTVSSY